MVMNLMVYTGQANEYGGLGHAEKVVLNLMNHYLKVGHALYMDYNSFGLAKKLLEVNTYLLRAGRNETPKDATTVKLKKGETKGAYKQNGSESGETIYGIEKKICSILLRLFFSLFVFHIIFIFVLCLF